MNTHKLTLGESAKATGKSKTTIHNAVKSGKLSAPKIDGVYQVDPSELFRVFTEEFRKVDGEWEQVNTTVTPQIERSVTPENGEVNTLNKVIEQLEARIIEKDERISEYKKEVAKSENLLTDQRTESEKARAALELAESEKDRAIAHAERNRPRKRSLTLKERLFGGEILVVGQQQR